MEPTELIARGVGQDTDIVSKEMFAFERGKTRYVLRPEMTAPVMRSYLQHSLDQKGGVQKLYYIGPCFRAERPQKGRYRQFHQFGAEVYGIDTPDIDAELILIGTRLWQQLGLKGIRLELNTLGSNQARIEYKQVLVDYLEQHRDLLDEDSIRRLETNPLRILDSKNPSMREMLDNAPALIDHLDEESSEQFDKLKARLDATGVKYTINPRLVRGLDYYCKTVFEWVTDELGAQGTICAGGRYDGLVEQLGGKATPAIGFALGKERILALLESQQQQAPESIDIYLVLLGEASEVKGLQLAEEIRQQLPDVKMIAHCGGGSVKSQMKKADKSGARIALILAEDELKNATLNTYGQWGLSKPGTIIIQGQQLFPRIDKKKKTVPQPQQKNAQKKEKEAEPLEDGLITFDQFGKVELRVAEIIAAEKIAKADKLIKLTVKAPEERTIVAGIALHYSAEELVGKLVLIVANLKPAKLMGVKSQGMVLAAKETDENGTERLVLATVSDTIAPGSKIS